MPHYLLHLTNLLLKLLLTLLPQKSHCSFHPPKKAFAPAEIINAITISIKECFILMVMAFIISAGANAFLYLLLIQGFFSGLTIGKLSEGTIKPGIKHSFILMVMAFIISAGANAFFGG